MALVSLSFNVRDFGGAHLTWESAKVRLRPGGMSFTPSSALAARPVEADVQASGLVEIQVEDSYSVTPPRPYSLEVEYFDGAGGRRLDVFPQELWITDGVSLAAMVRPQGREVVYVQESEPPLDIAGSLWVKPSTGQISRLSVRGGTWVPLGVLPTATDAWIAELVAQAGSLTQEAIETLVNGGTGTIAPERLPKATTTVQGAIEIATNAEVTGGARSDLAVTPASLAAWEASKRPARNVAVFVGSSNVVTGGWTTTLSNAMGWSEKNFAVSGAPYKDDGFYNQLTNASNDASFSNDSVGFVFLADCSNDIRAKNNFATSTWMGTAAPRTISRARSLFPNARVIVLPVIWPADPQAHVTGVPGGYQHVWHKWLIEDVLILDAAARDLGAEWISQSWTWLTGKPSLMSAGGDVHPNSAGHQAIAGWVRRYLAGGDTMSRDPWTVLTGTNGSVTYGNSGSRDLSWRRDGSMVTVNGAVTLGNPTAGAGGAIDVATLPVGIRPTYPVDMLCAGSGSVATAFPNGVIRVSGSPTTGQAAYIAGKFEIF